MRTARPIPRSAQVGEPIKARTPTLPLAFSAVDAMVLLECEFDDMPKLPKFLRLTLESDGVTECSGLNKFAALKERQYTPNSRGEIPQFTCYKIRYSDSTLHICKISGRKRQK